MRIKSEKNQKKCILKLKWLKIDGCMHPLLKIDGCSCTLCTRYYEGPVQFNKISNEILTMAILTFAAFFLNVSLVVEFLAIPEMVTFLCVNSMLKSEQKKMAQLLDIIAQQILILRLKMITQGQNEMS